MFVILQIPRQGNVNVKKNVEEYKMLMMRCDVNELKEQTMI